MSHGTGARSPVPPLSNGDKSKASESDWRQVAIKLVDEMCQSVSKHEIIKKSSNPKLFLANDAQASGTQSACKL